MRLLAALLATLLTASTAAGLGSPWTQVEAGSPDGRQSHGFAYDSARGRTVLFGGLVGPAGGGAPLGDTWEWDGQRWTPVATGDPAVATHPSARSEVSMAYDRKRQRVVLFGGRDAQGNVLADTWEWDGSVWTRLSTGGPPARSLHALTYDDVAQQVLLFGGVAAGGGYLADTWRWTGAAWQQLAVTGPPARQGPAMTLDATRKAVVLYGGLGTGPAGTTVFSDTWEWNGTSWSNKTSAGGPGPLFAPELVYEAAAGRVLLFGGLDNAFLVHSDLWSWNGTSWTKLAAVGPSARLQLGADYDTARSQVVLFGGADSAGRSLDDTWELGGTVWQRRNLRSAGPRTGAGAAFDEFEQSTIVFGGSGNSGLLGDTWAWSGTGWARLATTGPPARSDPAMAYDELSGRVVLFGGAAASALNDTWEWNGGWTQRCAVGSCPLNPPSRRSGAALVFDHTRSKVILFGGENAGVPAGDTWEWNTVADLWTRVATTGPSARAHHGLAADRTRQRVVLFGGRAAGGAVLNDTWEWNGSSWAQIATSGAPPARWRHGLAYDRIRGRVVMYGGTDGSGKPLLDMWEWDGATWHPAAREGPTPRERFGHGLVYDALRRRIVLVAGTTPNGLIGDTWENFALGARCQTAEDCHSGFCVDGVCCENACDQPCRRCNLHPPGSAKLQFVVFGPDGEVLPSAADHDGICRRIPAGQPDVEGCPGETNVDFTCRGTCAADGRCANEWLGERCGLCRVCNQRHGVCDQMPPTSKDEACGTTQCAALSNECRTYRDLQNTCVVAGVCAEPYTDDCSDYTDAPHFTPCNEGRWRCVDGGCRPGPCHMQPDGHSCPGGICRDGRCEPSEGCTASASGEEGLRRLALPLLATGGLGLWLAARALRRRSRS